MERPLPFEKRREHILALQALFDDTVASFPSLDNEDLRSKIVHQLSERPGSDEYDSLFKFVTDTHPG